MAKTNQGLDFTSFITKKPSEKKQTSKNKTEAEKKIINKTATPVVRPTQSRKKATQPINVPPEQDNIVDTKEEYVEKEFTYYFEKKFTTENSDLVAIDRNLKNKIALLCSTNRKTSQISLVSNIIQEWFDKNEKEVNKQLKSIFK